MAGRDPRAPGRRRAGIAAVTAPSTSATTWGPSTRARPLSSARRSSVSSSCSRASRSVTDSSGKRGTGSCLRRRYACRSFRSRLDRLSRSTASLKAGCIKPAPLVEGWLRQYELASISASGSPTHLRRRSYRSTAAPRRPSGAPRRPEGYSACVVYKPVVDGLIESGIERGARGLPSELDERCQAGDPA